MELILKSDSEISIAKIIALANKLNVTVEHRTDPAGESIDREELKKRILNFRATEPSSFGDPLEWQLKERENRDLPFFK